MMANTSGDVAMTEGAATNDGPTNVSQTATPSQTVTSPRSKGKRKAAPPRSGVWEHFTKFDGGTKCKCNYCGFVYTCDSSSCGTSTYWSHLNKRCTKYPFGGKNKIDNKQAQISIHTSMSNEGTEGENKSVMSNWKFDQLAIRKALAYMVIKDELPFKFVDGLGFKYFCNVAQPKFVIPVRTTIARDCYEIYVDEMMKLKSFMKTHCKRVCLTTDTWTSIQRINYMCLTAHFIDNDWKLNKKILNFCPISSHRGDAIGKAIEKCLNIWGIEKVMTVTVDNALRVSGALYVTSNSYFHEISNVDCILKQWCRLECHTFGGMAVKMKEKCDKYWGNPEKLNMLLFVAVILDPRYKLDYVEFSISQMYSNEKAIILKNKLKATIFALYDEYKKEEASSNARHTLIVSQSESSSSTASIVTDEQPSFDEENFMLLAYKQHKAEKESGDVKSELSKYLEDETAEMSETFDILGWWKVNSVRFPTLALMARDVLAIPVSTVASESAFSTGGRVLDPFRSSLSPKIVEALICTQDWLRASKDRVCFEEKLEEIEQLDEELSSITSAPTVIDTA